MKHGRYKNCQECKRELVDGYQKDNHLQNYQTHSFVLTVRLYIPFKDMREKVRAEPKTDYIYPLDTYILK